MSEINVLSDSAPLASASHHSPRRRLTIRLAVAGAVVVAVAVGTIAALSQTGGTGAASGTAFAVERLPSGDVTITVISTTVSAKQMTDQLRAQGLNVTVNTTAASPQLVGSFVAASSGPNASPALEATLKSQLNNYSSTLQFPAALTSGGVTLTFGRAPRAGETLSVVGRRNALAPGGLLYCYRLAGDTPQQAASTLTKAGYVLHWRGEAQQSAPVSDAQYTATIPSGVVVNALTQDPFMTSATAKDVYLRVLPTDDPAFATWLWQGYPPAQEASGTRDYSSCPAG